MFTTKEKLIQRCGKNNVGRYDFLKLLVTEYEETTSLEKRKQILANLANFSYDPINYGYIRQLKIIDLLLNALSDGDENIVQYAIGGICNLCLDPINKTYVLRNQAIVLVTSLLSSKEEETIISAITTLIFLITPESKAEITSIPTIKQMQLLSKSESKRIINLTTIFLNDYCESCDL